MKEHRVTFEFDIVSDGQFGDVTIQGFLVQGDGNRRRVVALKGKGNPIEAMERVMAELAQTLHELQKDKRFIPMNLWGFRDFLFQEVLGDGRETEAGKSS